eukprot:3160021-Amphidinium_carterae.1
MVLHIGKSAPFEASGAEGGSELQLSGPPDVPNPLDLLALGSLQTVCMKDWLACGFLRDTALY